MASRFKPLPGTARKYLDTETGREVSRRQRDNIMERAGQRTKHDLARVTAHRIRMHRRHEMAVDYAKKHGITLGQARKSKGLVEATKQLGSKDWHTVVKGLKSMGRREGIPDYVKPGESAAWKKSGVEKLSKADQRKAWTAYKRSHL